MHKHRVFGLVTIQK